MKIDHILVPVDFSEGSESALCCAMDVAEKFGARLTLLHVLHPVPVPVPLAETAFPGPVQEQAMRESAEKELRNLATLIAPRIRAETAVTSDVAWNGIVEHAAQKGVELIIMSTHGRSGVKHILLGSVA